MIVMSPAPQSIANHVAFAVRGQVDVPAAAVNGRETGRR